MTTNPILSIAGVMPGTPEMTGWNTAYPNPDAHLSVRPEMAPAKSGPSFTIAGVMPGAPTVAHWHTAYPDGECIYVEPLRQAEARAELAGNVVALPRRTSPRRALTNGQAKAA